MNKIYPFKFLDSYSKDDTSLFFGRDEEIGDLYRMIFESHILMVYGASGTGKTSLIQCGLASKFQPQDWLAIYVRRGSDINMSLDKAIVDESGISGTADVAGAFKLIYRNSFRPVYLIFDQFEELFILGTEDERSKFIETLLEIADVEQPVKMIFSMREEYLGHLSDFEKRIPGLMHKKLRVEAMGLNKVREVIKRATTIPGSVISLKAGEEEAIVRRIFEKVRGTEKTDTIELPYLQVFLDKLYRQTTEDSAAGGNAVFTLDAINKMGDIDDILRDFLEEQVKAIGETLNVDGSQVTPEEIWMILSPFATLQGTKDPLSMLQLQDLLQGKLTGAVVKNTVNALISGRILRYDKERDIYELAHDALAGKIAAKRSNAETERMEVAVLIKDRLNQRAGDREFFSEKQLNRIDAVRDLKVTPEEIKFIGESKAELRRQKRNKMMKIVFVVSVLSVASVISTFLWFRELIAKKQYQSFVLSGQSFLNAYGGDVTMGFRYAQYAYDKSPDNLDALRAIYVTVYQPVDNLQCLFYKRSFTTHVNIRSAVYAHDGNTILVCYADSTLKVWDVSTGKLVSTLAGHLAPVNAAAFSSDDNKVVTASQDSTARIWNVATGKPLWSLRHASTVNWAGFSPDGSMVLTRSGDSAKVWDATTGKPRAAFVHQEKVASVVFSPDSKMILTASYDKTAKIWDAVKGRVLAILPHKAKVVSALFSPDGKTVLTICADSSNKIWEVPVSRAADSNAGTWDASGRNLASSSGRKSVAKFAVFSPDSKDVAVMYSDSTATIWDVATGAELKTLVHKGEIITAAFSYDSRRFVTASRDKTAQVLDADSGVVVQLKGHRGPLSAATFSPDGAMVLTSSFDKTARIWDPGSGNELAILCGHTAQLSSAVFSADGSNILTTSFDQTVKVWSAANAGFAKLLGEPSSVPYVIPRPVNFSVFAPDSKKVVTATGDTRPAVWDVATGKKLKTFIGHSAPVYSAVFSPDGKRIITTSYDSTAKIWDAITGKELATLRHNGMVKIGVFSDDGKRILTVSSDFLVKTWDGEKYAELATLKGHKNIINSAVFQAGGEIVTASDDSTAIIWSPSGKQLFTLKHNGKLYSAVFSPDGKKVATAGADFVAKVWDAATGKELKKLSHTGLVSSAVFSSDGNKIVTASGDNTAIVWDVRTGTAASTLSGHTDIVHTAFFSPDDQMIVTTSGDNTTRLWDVAVGKELAELTSNRTYPNSYIFAASFSPDGKRIISLSNDRTAKTWLVSIPEIISKMDKGIEDLDGLEKGKYNIKE